MFGSVANAGPVESSKEYAGFSERLFAVYTMAAERDTHHAILGGGSPRAIAAPVARHRAGRRRAVRRRAVLTVAPVLGDIGRSANMTGAERAPIILRGSGVSRAFAMLEQPLCDPVVSTRSQGARRTATE